MRAALKTLVVLALGTAALLWFVNLDGAVDIRAGSWTIALNLPVALAALLVLVAAILLLVLLYGSLRRMPRRMRARQAERDRAEGEHALTRVLVSLAAGRGEAARGEVGRARRLLGDTPQLLLLTAEAARLDGDERGARAAFEALAARDDSRFLGLRGLLRQAVADEDWDRARSLAAELARVEPDAAWVREERAQLALRTENWREALQLAGKTGPRAQLAFAAARQEADAEAATKLEQEAVRADVGFAPAALSLAQRLRKAGHPKRANALLAESYAKSPNPEVAAALLEPLADAGARLRLVEEFTRAAVRHPESRLVRARACLDAGQADRAKQELLAAMADGSADRRHVELLAEADPEDAVRWRAEAASAADAPGWRCGHCGTGYAEWRPRCANCGTVAEINWTAEPRAASEVQAAA
jgi:HemY protein